MALLFVLPGLAFATEPADETPVNHALVNAIAQMEGATPASNSMRLDNLALAVAGLEADGPWHGSVTYRTQFVSGGPYDGFDQGVRLGLNYKECVLENLLVNIQMEFDTNNELFDKQLQYGGSHAFLDEAYFKYSN